jgi:hypothetical protein
LLASYAAFRTDSGGAAVTVCEDKTGTDESSRRAAGWVKENVSTTVDPPAITEGDTVLQFWGRSSPTHLEARREECGALAADGPIDAAITGALCLSRLPA